ncbi:MAG: hypothetical protein IJM87_02000, partial [Ruminococcus sp.]|nr:hypothetical protein [Ruminococcus sp.]
MNFRRLGICAAAAVTALTMMTAQVFADQAYVDPNQQYTDPGQQYVDPNQQYADPTIPPEDTDPYAQDPTQTAAPVVTDAPVETQPAETQPVVTQAPVETQATEVQTTYTPPEPTASPANIKLTLSEVKDKKFTAEIIVDSPKKIANAQFSIEYDQALIKYEGCEHNDEAGGMAVENSFDGKFVYNYVNPEGTAFAGTFCTVTFSIIDDSLSSSVLYLTANDLSDENGVAIACQSENAILRYQAEETSAAEDDSIYREVKLLLSKSPYTPKDLIADGDITAVNIETGSILEYKDGKFYAYAEGQTKVTIEYADGSVAKLLVKIENDGVTTTAQTTTTAAATSKKDDSESSSSVMMFIIIGIVVVLGIAAVIFEYFMIVKKRDPNDDEFDE